MSRAGGQLPKRARQGKVRRVRKSGYTGVGGTEAYSSQGAVDAKKEKELRKIANVGSTGGGLQLRGKSPEKEKKKT